MKPAAHSIHPDVCHLVFTGTVRVESSTFACLFALFEGLEAIGTWSLPLLATQDFLTTTTRARYPKDFIRPVTWIVSAGTTYMIVLSPYEVNELLPEIRANNSDGRVQLHTYAPRTMQDVKTFELLDFHTIPRAPRAAGWDPKDITQLNLWNIPPRATVNAN